MCSKYKNITRQVVSTRSTHTPWTQSISNKNNRATKAPVKRTNPNNMRCDRYKSKVRHGRYMTTYYQCRKFAKLNPNLHKSNVDMKGSQIGTHQLLNIQGKQVLVSVMSMLDRWADQVRSTGSREERQSPIASIWTEARLTRGNGAADATAADGKSRWSKVYSRSFVAIPWRHSTYWSSIFRLDVIINTSQCNWCAASMDCTRDKDRIQAPGPLSSKQTDSGAPTHSRNRGWWSGNPNSPDGGAKSESRCVVHRKAHPPSEWPMRGWGICTTKGPSRPNHLYGIGLGFNTGVWAGILSGAL